ncbi:aminotransferase-like domain-containing protein [Flindersiella endophytica]
MIDLPLVLDRDAGGYAAQLSEQLRDGIRSGRLAAGLRLPASRVLAADLNVSRGVVVSAYDQLIAEGFLVARHGDGTRVARHVQPERPLPPVSAPAAATAAYNLWPGTPDLSQFPRKRWAAAVRQALDELPASALGYPDPAGVPELRAELAAYLRRVRAAEVAPERVVVIGGVAQGLANLGQLFVRSGIGSIAVEDPSSGGCNQLLRSVGLTPVGVPVDDEGLDVTALARTGARVVLVTPAHQYPTGVVLSPRRRAALVDWARSTDGLIIEDDYDAEFRYDREPVGCLQGLAPDHVVLLGSLSKPLAPGLRLGWAVAPAPYDSALRQWRANTDLGSPVLEQYAFRRLLATGEHDKHLRAMRRVYRGRRDALVSALSAALPAARIRGVSAGLHVYVELPGFDEASILRRAEASGVVLEAAGPLHFRTPPAAALVLGYSRMSERKLAEAARVLASACLRAG